jgi:hypothetical protein
VPGQIRPTACGAQAKPAHVWWHGSLPHGPAGSSARPARARRGARAARGHRAAGSGAAASWRGGRRPAGRLGVWEPAAIAQAGRGGGAGQGGTDGDAPRQRRNDRAERSAQDSGVLVEGSSGDRQRVWRGPAARGDKEVRKWRLIEENGGSRRRSPMNGGRRRSSGGISCGRHPPVIGGGQEVGRGVGRAHAVGEEERKQGKGGRMRWRRRPF